jgi:hypothetical protein
MATSKYRTVLIKTLDNQYLVISPVVSASVHKTNSISFPIYSSDLVLEQDRLAEYELIKHLECREIFNYFIEDLSNEPNSRR